MAKFLPIRIRFARPDLVFLRGSVLRVIFSVAPCFFVMKFGLDAISGNTERRIIMQSPTKAAPTGPHRRRGERDTTDGSKPAHR